MEVNKQFIGQAVTRNWLILAKRSGISIYKYACIYMHGNSNKGEVAIALALLTVRREGVMF
jgi:hypothetical protein